MSKGSVKKTRPPATLDSYIQRILHECYVILKLLKSLGKEINARLAGRVFYRFFATGIINSTRTHSMARHHKSPCSRRNLLVIDLLTPSQGHQFDGRLKFSVYPGLLLIPFNFICHMTMFRKFNFWPLPKAPGGRDPKNCVEACATHVSNSHTKSGRILEKKNWPPNPPRYPQVPPLGMTHAAEWKSRLICYIPFICEKIEKVWFKKSLKLTL